MVKARDILKIKSELKKQSKLIHVEEDPVKRAWVQWSITEKQLDILDIKSQLINFEMCIENNVQLLRDMFIDRYIHNIRSHRLEEKYHLSQSQVSKNLKAARGIFEKKYI